ncbi:unnamed protein product [Ectocarpus sp. CCAP 1310/34]|nr:unnamed protein product [Ectocarpus sp. CCAP 1310/34]
MDIQLSLVHRSSSGGPAAVRACKCKSTVWCRAPCGDRVW